MRDTVHEDKIQEYLNLDLPQNKRILNRGEQSWDEFADSFSMGELFEMCDYIALHPMYRTYEYDFNDYSTVSLVVRDYINWLAFDFVYEDEYDKAQAIMNAAFN